MELHVVRIFVLPVHQVNCESNMNQKIDNIYKKIEAIKDDLLKLSHDIHSNPEIKWEEFLAVENILKLLSKYNVKQILLKMSQLLLLLQLKVTLMVQLLLFWQNMMLCLI